MALFQYDPKARTNPQTPSEGQMSLKRRVFMLLSTRSWPYAQHCVKTLIANSVEPVDLKLIVDNQTEAAQMDLLVKGLDPDLTEQISIVERDDVRSRLLNRFPEKKGLLGLHDGHPCWRKIIDPIVLSEPDEEIIVIDPDLYFPNRFAFEPTPKTGVMMMRQGPNCLFPADAVRAVYDLGVRLANHVDIGVAQVQCGAIDLDWLDWLAASIDLNRFRSFMHIEAIVWSALAMKMGGTHLNPIAWKCWERGHLKRLAVSLGVPGPMTLRLEPLSQIKCIHVSGPSKWWVTEAIENGSLIEGSNAWTAPVAGVPYREVMRQEFEREQRLKGFARSLGYQKLTGS